MQSSSDLKSAAPRPKNVFGRRKGAAIVSVLALVGLALALAVSVFRMSRHSLSVSQEKAGKEEALVMRDTVVSLVTAQLYSANQLIVQSTGNSRESLSWTTQPGALRTYSNLDPAQNRVYKLYSSPEPVIRNIPPGDSGVLLDKISADLASDWTSRPDEYTDLNRPISQNGTLRYPIADPRMYNGNPADKEHNTEGFRYKSVHARGIVKGVDAARGLLPMPARWIYQLRDGTLGYLNREREFHPLNPRLQGALTAANPIVGRMAWWADDESCKVNLNTASLPAIWDTPRTTSREDVWLANTQPLAGEYQRYPGHPATVDLSAVFFPGRRWTGTDGSWTMPCGLGMSGSLSPEQANLLWRLTPNILHDRMKGEPGTMGGLRSTPPKSALAAREEGVRRLASPDEVYFETGVSSPVSLDAPRQSMSDRNVDPDGALRERLERSQFFLTHRSSSMEMTNHGYPRVAMFPVDTRATQYLTTNLTGELNGTVSPYEVTMGIVSTLAGRPFYFQRRDPSARHREFVSTSDAADPQRNANLFRYLKELSRLPAPGYPAGFPGSTSVGLSPALPEEPNGLSLASKYPSGWNPVTGYRYQDSSIHPQNGRTLLDASDRSQILLSMMDYVYTLNTQPAFVGFVDRYDDGNGQMTALCGCGYDFPTDHMKALHFANDSYRVPRGVGRTMVPAEIAMVVNVAAMMEGGSASPSRAEWDKLKNLIPSGTNSYTIAREELTPGRRYMVEIGFVMSAFNPKIGWSPVNGRGGIVISGIDASSTGNVLSPPGSNLPFICDLGDGIQDQLRTCSVEEASSGVNSIQGTPRRTATDLIPYGGQQGPRAALGVVGESNGNNFAICAPFCVRAPVGVSSPSLSLNLSVIPDSILRVLTLDGEYSYQNVTAVADLSLPPDFALGIRAVYTGVSLRKQALEYTRNPSSAPFPDPRTTVRSLVIPHGDYRLASSLRMDQDFFVAHSGYRGSLAHSFYEANENPARRRMFASSFSPQTMINRQAVAGAAGVPDYPNAGTGTEPLSSLPLPAADVMDMRTKNLRVKGPKGVHNKVEDPALTQSASRDPARREIFAFGRRDGHAVSPKRGSSDPDETGDFDNGPGAAEDGPYMNFPDEGDRRISSNIPYFTRLTSQLKSTDGKAAQCISPNLLLRSPVDFGSIPTGLQARVPWQTLRFRPDPGMNDPAKVLRGMKDNPPAGLPFANFCGPRDHFFLDMFWMPVIEPWAISANWSTQGTINLNQQIFPYLYIHRSTALHALLRGERMLAIPNTAAAKYKKVKSDGSPDNDDPGYRHFINAEETVKQFTKRWEEGRDPENFPLAFNSFRSASEICEVWLVPDKNGGALEDAKPWDLSWIIGRCDSGSREGFWVDHRLTGDNARERPYANLYPRVTVRSNVFKLHLVTQSLESAVPVPQAGKAPGKGGPRRSAAVGPITVRSEWRGSCFLEREQRNRILPQGFPDHTLLNADTPDPALVPRLEKYQGFRLSNLKEFAPLP